MIYRQFSTVYAPAETNIDVQKEISLGDESISFSVRIPHKNYSLSDLELASLRRALFLIGQLIETADKGPKPPAV